MRFYDAACVLFAAIVLAPVCLRASDRVRRRESGWLFRPGGAALPARPHRRGD